MSKMKKRCQYQFELWEECNSNCKFCYLGNSNRITPKETKLENLQIVLDKISNDAFFQEINCLGYIGGEFFQGQIDDKDVKEAFFKVMKRTNQLLKMKKIDEVWISASMTIGNQEDLYDTLSLFDDLSKIWILTSYDTIGRFHSEKMKDKWIENLKKLRNFSKDVKINITSILTGDFIEKYLKDTLDIQEIASQYSCAMFWKPPCAIDRQDDQHKTKQQVNAEINNFFPTRKQFIDFLYKYKSQENDFMYDKLFNMNFRSDYLQKFSHGFHTSHRIKQNHLEETDVGCDVSSCGHSGQYQIYVDSDKCAICDKIAIQKIV